MNSKTKSFLAMGLCCVMGASRAVFAADAVTLFPAAGAKGVCGDTVLHIIFPKPVSVGTGSIKIMEAGTDKVLETIDVTPAPAPAVDPKEPNKPPYIMPGRPMKRGFINGGQFSYYPVITKENVASIYPGVGFEYNKSYYVTVDGTAFKDADGSNFEGITDKNAWTFTIKEAAPAADVAKITVAADGTGDFVTVQGALDFVAPRNTKPVTIFVRKGMYKEILSLSNKNNVTIIGEDRKQTIIDYENNNRFNGQRGIFMINGTNDLSVANLTLRNSMPLGGGQAETIILGSSARTIFNNVEFVSTQDTIQANSPAYFSDCYVEGTVDFIWGTGTMFFENSEFKTTRSKGYFTQLRNRGRGCVFSRCTFEGAEGVIDNVLGRCAPDQFPNSEVVLLDCTLGTCISPLGWLMDLRSVKGEPDYSRMHYWEFNSHDAKGEPVDVSKRAPSSKQLKQPDDSETIANYGNPAWVFGGNWNPESAPVFGELEKMGVKFTK